MNTLWGIAYTFGKSLFHSFLLCPLSIQTSKENTGCRCLTNNDLCLCGNTWEELQKNQLFQLLRRSLYWFFSKIESECESERPLRIMVLFRTSNDFLEAFWWLRFLFFCSLCEGEWIIGTRAPISMTRIELRARATDKWQFQSLCCFLLRFFHMLSQHVSTISDAFKVYFELKPLEKSSNFIFI